MPIKDPEKRKAVHREYMSRRYREDAEFREAHLERVKKFDKARKKRLRERILEFKKNGCLKCSEKEPRCLSAHHLESSEKDFGIATAVRKGLSPKKLEEELKKCVCLCHNCHVKVHLGKLFL